MLEFRSGSLDRIQNSLGKVAIALASTFNEQHKLGQDLNGDMGGDFFKLPDPVIGADYRNNATSTTAVSAKVSDPTKLTASDYAVKYDGANYVVTRQSDGAKTTINPYPQTVPQTIDGVDFSITGAAAEGDNFMVRPTANGAADLAVAITDRNKLAAGAPIATSAPVANTGSGKLSAGSVDKAYLTPGNALTAPLTLTYDKATTSLSGFPAGQAVTVNGLNGATTTYPAGTANIPYTEGDNFSFGGINVSMTGAPAQGDTFTIAPEHGRRGRQPQCRPAGGLADEKHSRWRQGHVPGFVRGNRQLSSATRRAKCRSAAWPVWPCCNKPARSSKPSPASTSTKRRPTCCATSKPTRRAARSCRSPAPCSTWSSASDVNHIFRPRRIARRRYQEGQHHAHQHQNDL